MSSQSTANVFIQTAFLGDVLLSVAALKKLKSLYPNQKTILVCRKGVGGLLVELQVVDEVIEIQKGHRQSYVSALKKLSMININQLIVPHTSVRTSLFCLQIKAQQKVSFQNFLNRFIYDTCVVKNKDLPEPVRLLGLFSKVDPELHQNILNFKNGNQSYSLAHDGMVSEVPNWASVSLKDQVIRFKSVWRLFLEKWNLGEVFNSKKWVLIFPGSVWATKRWTKDGFIDLGKKLSRDYQVFIMGGPGEEELCGQIATEINGAIDFSGKTKLLESFLMVAHSALVIGNDSASTHLASLAETPSLTFFGPTVINFGYRPWQNKAWILQSDTSCRPCGPHGHRKCPIKTHECMKSIPSENAYSLAVKIIHLCNHQH